MYKYGQYCPVSRAAEILGDRWTLLIVRDLLLGVCHFNELERGLPGISRALLSRRLRRLQRMGVVEKEVAGPWQTIYRLTSAGQALQPVIDALMTWGAAWAFGEPDAEELDPVLLMWWVRGGVRVERLPAERVVAQFDFRGATRERFWLILTREDVSLCLTYPGFDANVLVTADLATFYQVWLGRVTFAQAVSEGSVNVEAIPALRRAFPTWFAWSPSAPVVRAALGSAPF